MTTKDIAVVLACLAILLIVAGLIVSRDRRRHVPLMLAAFVADMIGLLLVELTPLFQGKTDPVTGLATEFGWMKTVHAVLATMSVVGYVIQILSGKKLLAGQRVALIGHQKGARFFLVTRFAAFITMFMV